MPYSEIVSMATKCDFARVISFLVVKRPSLKVALDFLSSIFTEKIRLRSFFCEEVLKNAYFDCVLFFFYIAEARPNTEFMVSYILQEFGRQHFSQKMMTIFNTFFCKKTEKKRLRSVSNLYQMFNVSQV